MTGRQTDITALFERMASTFLGSRRDEVEEALRRKATELNFEGTFNSGGGYRQMRQVIEDELRTTATGLLDIARRLQRETGLRIDGEFTDQLKERVRREVENSRGHLHTRLWKTRRR